MDGPKFFSEISLKPLEIHKISPNMLYVGINTTLSTQPLPSIVPMKQAEMTAQRHVLRPCRTPFSYICASSSLKNISFLTSLENCRFSTNPTLDIPFYISREIPLKTHEHPTLLQHRRNDYTEAMTEITTQSLRVAGRCSREGLKSPKNLSKHRINSI